MSGLHSFELAAADGKLIRGDRSIGKDRQILFITGFLSKRWGNKSKALAQWCEEKGWGFCCYDARGFGESEGAFTDYTLSEWIDDARLVLNMLRDGRHLTLPPQALSHPPAPSLSAQAPFPRDAPLPRVTIVGNSLGGWIAWLLAQEFQEIERLILVAPAFNMMKVRAQSIDPERQHAWHTSGWMPWDDEPAHRDFPLAWKWVEESEALWSTSFVRLRPVSTAILHGQQDSVILPQGSSQFVEQLRALAPSFPVELHLVPGDHRLSSPEHLDTFRRLVLGST
jgi:pimeloyl-ACP methyl ester carboxylesterase